MNLYFVRGTGRDAKIVTPSLTGSLLPGITRDSLLTLAADLGYETEEARISADEWREGNADGTLTEVFACGTAAVITPVGEAKSARGAWKVADGQPGRGHDAAARGAARHPDRPGRGPARLDAGAGLRALRAPVSTGAQRQLREGNGTGNGGGEGQVRTAYRTSAPPLSAW